jgi:hypothetical protein
MKRSRAIVLMLLAAFIPLPVPAASHLGAGAKSALTSYLSALQHEHYDDAFRLLISSERAYFREANNFASIFKADGLRINRFRIVGSRDAGSLGVVGVVSENIAFFDHAHQAPGSATVTVPYGVIAAAGAYRIKDPFHPWKAFRTTDAEITNNGLRVTIRKVSFFADRIEVLLTFANFGDRFVTVLPYGRTVLRDGAGRTYHPIATRSPALTDKQLYLGLRLASNAQYTGALNFAAATAHAPRRLQLTIAPVLRDGADAPFDVAFSQVDVP